MKYIMYFVLVVIGINHSHVLAKNNVSIDPVELMEQVEQQNSPSDEVVQISMTLVDSAGKVNNRSAVFYRKRKNSESMEDMKLIRFDSPAELNGSAVLILENKDRADDQWLYLPAYHTSRKVPPSNRSDRYMGTDFFYEDVSDDKTSQYKYTVAGEEIIGSRSLVIIEQIPMAEDVKHNSAYSKKVQWVDPDRLIVTRIDYYDQRGELFKRYEASNSIQVSGFWRWSSATMTDLKVRHKTIIDYSNRKIGQGLDSVIFTVRSLERSR